MNKPLTVTLDPRRSHLVRSTAQEQGVTYRCLVHALVDMGLESGRRPYVREPWGEWDGERTLQRKG